MDGSTISLAPVFGLRFLMSLPWIFNWQLDFYCPEPILWAIVLIWLPGSSTSICSGCLNVMSVGPSDQLSNHLIKTTTWNSFIHIKLCADAENQKSHNKSSKTRFRVKKGQISSKLNPLVLFGLKKNTQFYTMLWCCWAYILGIHRDQRIHPVNFFTSKQWSPKQKIGGRGREIAKLIQSFCPLRN